MVLMFKNELQNSYKPLTHFTSFIFHIAAAFLVTKLEHSCSRKQHTLWTDLCIKFQIILKVCWKKGHHYLLAGKGRVPNMNNSDLFLVLKLYVKILMLLSPTLDW